MMRDITAHIKGNVEHTWTTVWDKRIREPWFTNYVKRRDCSRLMARYVQGDLKPHYPVPALRYHDHFIDMQGRKHFALLVEGRRGLYGAPCKVLFQFY